MLAELGYLGSDHSHAVGLVRIIGKVLLVIILGHVELIELHDLGDDGFAPNVLVVQLFNELLSLSLLFVIVIENRRAILSAHIRALTVERGRVMDRKEYVQYVLVSDDLRVEFDLYDLRMPGPARADVAVAGVSHFSSSITGLD